YNIDPVEVKYQITPNTRAIIATHYAGQPCDLDAIHGLAGEKGISVVEDATMALGACYRGRRVGSASDMAVFSFELAGGPVAGGGGMVTTNSEELYRWLNVFRNSGVVSDPALMIRRGNRWYYEMQELGFAYRMSDLQAALALSQLAKAGRFLERRTAIAEQYNRAFREVRTLTLPRILPGVRPAWTMYPVSLRLERLSGTRDEIANALLAENIGVTVPDPPLPGHPYFIWQGHKDICSMDGSVCPRADDLHATFLALPLYPGMTDGDTGDVIEAVQKVLAHYSEK
ncbi:MAG: DegT/DnrJ/EryC1/StrS family aminotransferase, partial [Firmicutes bacterium]|nr:DegT/DnrJ/EryC1/StrS family aminotransferase [Bacillota bacterium]